MINSQRIERLWTPSRRGISMMEMTISMSLATTLMIVAVSWMHQTLRYSSKLQDRQRYHQALSNLEDSLRSDVRLSKSISMSGDDCLMVENRDGSITRFTIEADSVSLVKKRGDGLIAQDRFSIPSTVAAKWDVTEMPAWISLVVERVARGESHSFDAKQNKQDKPEPEFESFNVMPIDLCVRVGPNPWNSVAVVSENPDVVEEEAAQDEAAQDESGKTEMNETKSTEEDEVESIEGRLSP